MPTPFEALYAMMSQVFPAGRRYASDTYWSAARPGAILKALAGRVGAAPDPQSFAFALFLPPVAVAARLPDAAFAMHGPVFAACYAVWNDAAADAVNLAWLRGTDAPMWPLSLGHYVGEADLERPGRLHKSFSPEAWSKLQSLKRTYDPAGRFLKPDPNSERNAA
jgi:FAD/FMN-containing dehydrogenase